MISLALRECKGRTARGGDGRGRLRWLVSFSFFFVYWVGVVLTAHQCHKAELLSNYFPISRKIIFLGGALTSED